MMEINFTRGIPKTKMHQNVGLKKWKLASISIRTNVNVYDTIVISVFQCETLE